MVLSEDENDQDRQHYDSNNDDGYQEIKSDKPSNDELPVKELSIVVEHYILKHCDKQSRRHRSSRSKNVRSNASVASSVCTSTSSITNANAIPNSDANKNTFLFQMKRSSLVIEENYQIAANQNDEQGKECFVDLGSIILNCDNPQESEYIIGLVLFFGRSMKAILP